METRSRQKPNSEDYKISSLPDSTSDFRKKDIEYLKIKYEEVKDPNDIIMQQDNIIPEFLFIKNYNRKDIQNIDDLDNHNELNNDEKTLIDLLQRIIKNEDVRIGTRESFTDTFVDHLLRKLGFETYPLRLNVKPFYSMKIKNKEITSEYDFSIEKRKSILMVEEDKHLKNTVKSQEYGEYQIAGEILAGGFTNYVDNPCDQIIYGMRVIGTKFTFYKSYICEEYLGSLIYGLPEKEMKIYKYSKNTEKGYDFMNINDRKEILQMLTSFKSQFLIN
jgi:hypothetical protein